MSNYRDNALKGGSREAGYSSGIGGAILLTLVMGALAYVGRELIKSVRDDDSTPSYDTTQPAQPTPNTLEELCSSQGGLIAIRDKDGNCVYSLNFKGPAKYYELGGRGGSLENSLNTSYRV